MAALPYMPLYVADYLADAAHLNTTEHGAYLLLIMTYWQTGKPLPDDDRKLARICRLTLGRWKKIRPSIEDFFESENCTENDKVGKQLRHRRVDRELSKVRDNSLKKRKAGLARAQQMHSTRSAHAQLTDTDTEGSEEETSSSSGASAPPDLKKTAFDIGRSVLVSSGKSDSAARKCIGQWVRDYGVGNVVDAVAAAQRETPSDPIPFISGRLKWLAAKSSTKTQEEEYAGV